MAIEETNMRTKRASVAHLSLDEVRWRLGAVGLLLRELRPTFVGMQIFWVVPLTLRLVHRQEELPPGDTLSAPEDEFEDWLRAFLYYLLAIANVPGVDAQDVDDAAWALAQAGLTRAELLTNGQLDALAKRRVERLITRVVDQCRLEQAPGFHAAATPPPTQARPRALGQQGANLPRRPVRGRGARRFRRTRRTR